MADSTDETRISPLTAAKMDDENDEYATPPELWRPLARAVGGFDVDPCSGAEATPIAETRYTEADDGLEQAWHGDVFVNPPWSTNGNASAKEVWLTKARSEANRDAVSSVTVLLPSDTSTHWFHDHVMAAPVVCFVGPGRITFVGEDRNPSIGLVIAVYGDDAERLVEPVDDLGAVVRGRRVHQASVQARLPEDDGDAE